MAEVHHELHVVLHHEERLAGLIELVDAIGQVRDQGRVDAAGRLVEQQYVGIRDEQRGKLEQLALPERQVARRLVRESLDSDELEQLRRAALLGR